MAIDAFVQPFLSLPLFQGLKPLQLTEIVRRADRIVYQPGDVLIEEDTQGDAAIVIVSGDAVRVQPGMNPEVAEAVPEGAMLGELAMLVETVHSATVVARTRVKALRLTREDIHAVMLEDPSLATHFSDRIAERLSDIFSQLQAVERDLSTLTDAEPTLMRSQAARTLGHAVH